MNILQTVILGLVQGITEFLPISSSGHLYLIRYLFGLEESGTSFDAAIHIGTLAATFIVFWPEIKEIAKNNLKGNFLKIAIATLPALAIGFLLQDTIDGIKSPIFTAIMLILLGLVFVFFKKSDTSKSTKVELPEFIKTFLVGLSQVVAFLPGTSRSGVTVLTGRLMGLDFRQSLYTSFILGIPVIAAAGLWGTYKQVYGLNSELMLGFALSVVTSFISGYFAGKFLKDKLPQIGLAPFGWYRIILGMVIFFIVLYTNAF